MSNRQTNITETSGHILPPFSAEGDAAIAKFGNEPGMEPFLPWVNPATAPENFIWSGETQKFNFKYFKPVKIECVDGALISVAIVHFSEVCKIRTIHLGPRF